DRREIAGAMHSNTSRRTQNLVQDVSNMSNGFVFSAVYAQMSTMFVEQRMAMDTTIGSFTLPAANLTTFNVISVIFWVPVYD
nr:protein NRT1/ PTR FAMILY 8.3-like [Tanacetum cinerariifolium]